MKYTDLCCNSENACPGCLFFCIKGAKHDGHSFAAEAYNKGCRSFVVSDYVNLPSDAEIIYTENTRKAFAEYSLKFFNHPEKRIFTIAITGTKGKTGTLSFIKAILEKAGITVGTMGTLGIEYNGKHIKTENTTVQSYELCRYMNDMALHGVSVVIIEASSQGFAEYRTHGIDFDIGIFTNFSPDHIGKNEHQTIAEYFECKKKLFSQCKIGIINGDDEKAYEISEGAKCKIIRYGINKNFNYCGENASFYKKSNRLYSEYDFVYPGGKSRIVIPFPGLPSIYNSLCASTVCRLMSIDVSAIADGSFNTVIPGRYECFDMGKFTAMIDYAHNELSANSLFETLDIYNFQRIITVFGCGGNRSKLRREAMGRIISENSDICIITSDNPRYEDTEKINGDIIKGMTSPKGIYEIINDRKAAIEKALSLATEGDLVLILGKGHEDYMEIKGEKLFFSEKEIIYSYRDTLRDNLS